MPSPRRSRKWLGPLLVTGLGALAACAADRHDRRATPPAVADTPPRFESRVGVPVLMDIPVLGFLFGRRTVAR